MRPRAIPFFFVVVLAALLGTGSAHALTITVPGDFDTIQEAIEAAANGDDIAVGPGTWTSDTEQIIDFEGKQIRVYSTDGPEVTILDGRSTLGRRCRAALCDEGLTNLASLEGFTIVNCLAPNYDWNGNGQADFWEYFGGAIWCRDGSSPSIRNCVFRNCSSEYGGAICNWDEFGTTNSPLIFDCTFEDNSAGFGVGGAIYSNGGSPTLSGCLFTGNSAYNGGAVMNFGGSDASLDDCQFIDNFADRGGAMFNDTSMPELADCTFIDNRSNDHGGAVFNADPSGNQNIPVFTRCTFTGNQSGDEGGAMHNFSCSPVIESSSFSDNIALDGGAILSWNQSNPVISGSSFCGNAPEDIDGAWTDGSGNSFDPTCGGSGPAGDLNGDLVVDGQDLTLLLADWGCSGPDCTADLNGDAVVNGQDLTQLLADWS